MNLEYLHTFFDRLTKFELFSIKLYTSADLDYHYHRKILIGVALAKEKMVSSDVYVTLDSTCLCDLCEMLYQCINQLVRSLSQMY